MMIALIVVMGLMPQPFLAPAKPAVDRLVPRFQATEVRLGRDRGGHADDGDRLSLRAARPDAGGARVPDPARAPRGPLT